MKAKPNTSYGYYRGDWRRAFCGGNSPWEAITEVIRESLEDGEDMGFFFFDFYVGEYTKCDVIDLVSREVIQNLFEEDRLSVDGLLEYLSERHRKRLAETSGAEVYLQHCKQFLDDGEAKWAWAYLNCDYKDTQAVRARFQGIVDAMPHKGSGRAEELKAAFDRLYWWTFEYVRLWPSEICQGVQPLPVTLVGGEWHFGRESEVPSAVAPDVSINYQYRSDGNSCWIWEASDGTAGEAWSLQGGDGRGDRWSPEETRLIVFRRFERWMRLGRWL